MDIIERNLWKSGNGKAVNLPKKLLKGRETNGIVNVAVLDDNDLILLGKMGFKPIKFR